MMVDRGGGSNFPVIFYDGEREINIGDIRVQPLLEFKVFQKMIADGIGISPNQISIYIVQPGTYPDDRRKIPITGKVNFSFIVRQKGSYFLVILKRSRRFRGRRSRSGDMEYRDYFWEGDLLPSPQPENVVLLRRNFPVDGYAKAPYYPGEAVNFAGLVSGSGKVNPVLDPDSFPRIEDTMMMKSVTESKFVCEECVYARVRGRRPPFHACVNDPVIERFRTRVGPIAKPGKACD